jgi:hypothetical protein
MTAAPALPVEPSAPHAKALTHRDVERRKAAVPCAPGSLRPLRSQLLHAAGDLFECQGAWNAAEIAAQDDDLAPRFACPPENEHYLRKLGDGRIVPLELEEQVRLAIERLGREGRLPQHPGMRRQTIAQVVAAAASIDEGAGGRASTAAIAYEADLSVRHTRDVLKYAMAIGLIERIRRDRASDWAGAPLGTYRDRRGIWIVHVAPREIARTMSDAGLLELAAKGDRYEARPAPRSSWNAAPPDRAAATTTPSAATEVLVTDPAKPPAAGDDVTKSPSPPEEAPPSASPAPAQVSATAPAHPFRRASVEALRQELARLPALLAELARVTKRGIFLDPLDVATMGTTSPPDGPGLSAEMVLRTVEEMIAKILSGKTYATARHPEAWTRAMLRERLRGFFMRKRKDIDAQEKEDAHELQKTRADEALVRGLRGAAERRALEEDDDGDVLLGEDDDVEPGAEDRDGGAQSHFPTEIAAFAEPPAPARSLVLAATGDAIFDRAAHQTRALSVVTFDRAFALVQFDGLVDGVLSLRFANEFARYDLEDKFLPTLTAKITEQIGRRLQVQKSIDPNLSRPLVRWAEEPEERGPPA